MKGSDLQKAPKLFVENIKINFSAEYFIMGLSSGNRAHIFSMTPGHAKRLQQYLSHEIQEFEAKHGEITAKWDPNVVSPVQRSNPPSEGS